MFYFFFCEYLDMKLVGHRVDACLIIWKTARMISQVILHLSFTSNVREFQLFHIQKHWVVVRPLNFSHFLWVKRSISLWFYFAFLWWQTMLRIPACAFESFPFYVCVCSVHLYPSATLFNCLFFMIEFS